MGSPTPASVRADVLEIIDQSTIHAQDLLESLREEFSALETQNADALMLAVDAKQRSVDALRQLDERRMRICRETGFDTGPFEMEKLAAWCDENRAILDGWDRLMEVAGECNAQNLTNGSILRTRQRHMESSLAVLRGDASETHTYYRDGKSNTGHKLELAKA